MQFFQYVKQKLSPFEYCVSCGEKTSYRKTLDISLRYGYIQGAGQLCYACYSTAYPKDIPHVSLNEL